jgi:hypothetical protein
MNAFLGILFGVVGGLLSLFAIGWLIMFRFYPHAKLFEKLIYSITLSISVTIIIGLIFSYLKIFGLVPLVIAYVAVAIALIIVSHFTKHKSHQ